ncbi:translocation/assembly module TamB domain-containing protein [bacterium]|nr:translocation/assembly module TamB domain-containing protein [bacterium]
MKTTFRYFRYLLLGFVVLAVTLTIISQTDFFRNLVRLKVLAFANEQLNAIVEIEALEGNLLTQVDIVGLSVQMDQESIINVGRVSIHFRPLSLLSKTLELSHVVIDSAKLRLSQLDSTWSYQRILRKNADPTLANNSNEMSFGWQIAMPDIRIAAGEASIQSLSKKEYHLPKRISQINLNAGFWLESAQVQVALRDLNFTSHEPDLILRTFRSDLSYTSEETSAKNIELETDNSKLVADFDFKNHKSSRIDFNLEAHPLSFSEVRSTVPFLRLYGEPSVEVKTKGPLDDLELNGKLNLGQTKLALLANLNLGGEPFLYNIRGSARHLNLAELIQNPQMASNLNLDFHLEGQEVDWGRIKADLTVNLDSSLVAGKWLTASELSCQIARDSILFDLSATADQTQVQATGFVNLGAEAVRYTFDSQLQNFNLEKFTDSIDIRSDLNLELQANGEWIDPDEMSAELKIRLASSTVNNVIVDSAYFNLRLKNQTLNVKEALVTSPLGQVTASGSLAADGENDVAFRVELEDLSRIATFVGQDSVQGHGQIEGQLTGSRQSLHVHADLNLADLKVSNVAIRQLVSTGEGFYSPTGFSLNINGELNNINAFGLDSLHSVYEIKSIDTLAQFVLFIRRGDDSSLEVNGSATSDFDSTTIDLSHLQLDVWNHRWQMGEPTRVSISNARTQISEFVLASEEQYLRLFGHIDPERGSDLRFALENLRISNYDSLLHLNGDLDGQLNLAVTFKGTPGSPGISGNLKVAEGRILDEPFDKFSGYFDLEGGTAHWDMVLSRSKHDSLLESSGSVPVTVSLDSTKQRIRDDQPLEVKFNARGFDLSLLQPFTSGISNVQGTFIADIVLSNTLRDLKGVGPVRIVDGEFDIRELGTRYRDINAAMLLKDTDLVIKDLRIRSDNGRLELIEGGLSLSKQSVQEFKTRLRAKNFPLMKNKKMQAKVNGDLELTGSVQSPYFSGNLTVSESRIYYPAWFEDETRVELSSKPFFVIGPDSVGVDSSGAIRFQTSGPRTERAFTESEFYKKLRGELALSFPKNSWIRSSDTNIEISGDLVTVKEVGSDIALFGSLSTLRGHYELLGNRFKISRGNMVFYGQPEPDPGIDIEAEYEFRDPSRQDTDKHIFKVFITGSLSSPEFRFNLDGNQAEQQDVISILVFGQSYDNLPINQKSSVSDNSGLDEKATGLLTGQLLKRLSGEIGEELRLDMIQIESGKSFEDARLRIGKYVTPDVFVSVSQDFGAEGNRKVELEYEIPIKIRFLNFLLQASQEKKGATGMDIIWKIEW